MSYTNFDESGSTLTAEERHAEATKLLARISAVEDWEEFVSERAGEFVNEMIEDFDFYGVTASCSIKQLWWLRELVEQLED